MFDINMEYQRSLFHQNSFSKIERILLKLADRIYTSTGLKPMSKALFFLSRSMLVTNSMNVTNARALQEGYIQLKKELNTHAPDDDYNFSRLVDDTKTIVPEILDALNFIKSMKVEADLTGLAFNSLLRGKLEGGEGFGTYLTPEEVVIPIVEMMVTTSEVNSGSLKLTGLFGDICGGTGRFPFALKRILSRHDISNADLIDKCYLFDQSRMAVDFAKINFLLEGDVPNFFVVEDSLTSTQVSELKGKFQFLATNPPFGVGKYKFNEHIISEVSLDVLNELGFVKRGDNIDPAILFVFRNLDLLQKNGLLGIVLPDGILKSEKLERAIAKYEASNSCEINKIAEISLPVVTFALAGTVAKTSFAIYEKSDIRRDGLYKNEVRHVGFLKKGNIRIPDPKGNDLIGIVKDFSKILNNGFGSFTKHDLVEGFTLSDKAFFVREYHNPYRKPQKQKLHLSILDVDESGFIEILNALNNKPNTKPISCKPGDILISCINPKLWRVTVVPDLGCEFTCSPEFAVLRVHEGINPYELALLLCQASVKEQAVNMAKGTSSSRQRINKSELSRLIVPPSQGVYAVAQEIFSNREKYYLQRLREVDLIKSIIWE